MRIPLSKRKMLEGYLFILPWIIGFLVFLAFPLGRSLSISFGKMISLVGFKFEFVGVGNYLEAFLTDVDFVPSFIAVARDALINIPIILIFSFFVAFLINQKLPGRGVFRIIFFLPVVLACGPVIERLFVQQVGIMPILERLDIGGFIYTYLDPIIATPLVDILNRIMLVLWRSGVQILLCLAGLQAISPTLYEAAKCDGANEWSMLGKITIPMIMPILEVSAIYTIVDSFTDIFNPLLGFIQNVGFVQFRFGYAAALGWIYFIFIFAIIVTTLAIFRRYMFYEERE